MRLVVHEWCCSGGLAGPDAAALGDDAAAILPEAQAMFVALLADARRIPGLEVVALVAADAVRQLPAGIDRRPVPRGQELDALAAAAATADATLVVAPETAGILGRRGVGGPRPRRRARRPRGRGSAARRRAARRTSPAPRAGSRPRRPPAPRRRGRRDRPSSTIRGRRVASAHRTPRSPRRGVRRVSPGARLRACPRRARRRS
ncbi:MAG: hypothetical protein ACKOOF_06470, partial [Planctomycetaceae bacterium]